MRVWFIINDVIITSVSVIAFISNSPIMLVLELVFPLWLLMFLAALACRNLCMLASKGVALTDIQL